MTRCEIIQGDCLKVVPKLPKATLIFADPPDGIGYQYDGFVDKFGSSLAYGLFFQSVIEVGVAGSSVFWLSYNAQHHRWAWRAGDYWLCRDYEVRDFYWRYTFGQCNKHDSTGGVRPQMRIRRDKSAAIYPDAIRVKSQRLLTGDKRGNPAGRVPDSVWEFPRVVGNAKERRKWATTQHPEALVERIVKLCTKPGDLVIDMFAHSGTVNRVCCRLDRPCIGIEISPAYCGHLVYDLKPTRYENAEELKWIYTLR
jgi:DNA modification methylase